jgi:adenylate cyclase
VLCQSLERPSSSYRENKVNTRLTDKTIAVLPFVNMSSSKENEYFSDGITEEITNALAKLGSLKVTSRTSSFFFKGKNMPITNIGKQLNVSTILEGSVRLSGNNVRITAQLIQVKDDYHFWSETWDRKLQNIFKIQDEVSLLIADKLREHFGHFEIQESLVTNQTTNINAYEYCLRAKFHENKWNPEDIKMAISYYEHALYLDPKYAEALLGLANCFSFLGTTGFLPFEEAWGKTIDFTKQALALNRKSSGLHYQLSNQAFFIECDYRKSLEEMNKAIELNPNNAEAQQFISFLYILAGQRVRARKHLEIALSVNPLSEETQFFTGYFHYMIEDYAKSMELLDKCLLVNDKNIPAHSIKTLCLLKQGRYDEVITYFDAIPSEVVIQGEKTGAIALAYALKKDRANAAIYLEQLKAQAKEPKGFTADSLLFVLYAAIGEFDKAFAWVDNAIKTNSALLLLRYTDPLVNEIKTDPRYSEFKEMIFPENSIKEPPIKKKVLLEDDVARKFASELLAYLSDENPFLNPELSLRELANQIQIHPNQLSWLLNEIIGKNFNEFINQYRIEFFKSTAKDPKNAHLTIEGMAYESGFKSKTVFNTFFKKSTGLSPKEFLKIPDRPS